MKSVRTAVVLGSGGHTGEMFKLLSGADLARFRPREYVVADTDSLSIEKARAFEEKVSSENTGFNLNTIVRSRKVGQSYLTSVWTTFMALLHAIPLVLRLKPECLLVNGPGTCIPLCLITFLFSKLRLIPKCKIVFVESLCRVKTLSLTGKILYTLRLTDAFLVQWSELHQKYPKSIFMDRLV